MNSPTSLLATFTRKGLGSREFFPWLIWVERCWAFSVIDKRSWWKRCIRTWGEQFSDVLIVLVFLIPHTASLGFSLCHYQTQLSLIQHLSVSMGVGHYSHFTVSMNVCQRRGGWQRVETTGPVRILIVRVWSMMMWSGSLEENRFCAANNGFILQNKVSSRGSTCGPATVTQSRWTQARQNALSNLIGRDQEPESIAEISIAFVKLLLSNRNSFSWELQRDWCNF